MPNCREEFGRVFVFSGAEPNRGQIHQCLSSMRACRFALGDLGIEYGGRFEVIEFFVRTG